MRFQTTVHLAGKTATGFTVPPEVVDAFGQGKRPKVKITINGYSYRSTVAVMGGEFMLPLAAEHRESAGVVAGQSIDVDLELDTAPREVEVPSDLADALEHAGLREKFERLAYSHRKEHVRAVEEAKAQETRLRRIEKVLGILRG